MKEIKKGHGLVKRIENNDEIEKDNKFAILKSKAKDSKATVLDKLDYIIELLETVVK